MSATFFLAAFINFAITAFGGLWLARHLSGGALVAQPTDRSNHTVATPTGGGIAVLAGLIVSFAILLQAGHTAPSGFHIILAIGVCLALTGLVDDMVEVSPIARLGVQIVGVTIGINVLPSDTFLAAFAPQWLVTAFTFVVWVCFLNFYNFMDGIDGQTGVETITIGGGLALLAGLGIITSYSWVWPLLMGIAGAAFLVPNWRPAKIFLGDVGSVPLGFVFGFLLLITLREGHWLPVLLLPLYYFLDAGLTLIRRSIALKPIWRSHREHTYQRAGHVSDRHDVVVAQVIGANVVLLALVLFGELTGYRLIAAASGIAVGAVLLFRLEKLAGVDLIARLKGLNVVADRD